MGYAFFQVPTRGCEESEQALNSFLANHRVLSVAREFVNAALLFSTTWDNCEAVKADSRGRQPMGTITNESIAAKRRQHSGMIFRLE